MTINKRFIFIMSIALISLIALVLGIYFFTKDTSLTFTKNGYILQVMDGVNERYYFESGTKYKKNLNDQIVFNDKEKDEVTTELDSFVHYLDGSMMFLKNGVLMDLDSINETIVPYYNITDKLLIEQESGSYFIETSNKTLMFSNIIGRISENKYIVMGKNISLKTSDSNDLVKGDYFEIIFMIDGVVNIQNQELSYQTLAEGTNIYIGEDIVIRLGDKQIYYKDQEKASLTELTIDGTENIEIKPAEVTDTKDNKKNNTTTIVNNVTNTVIDKRTEEEKKGEGSGDGTGTETIITNPTISLMDATTSTNGINATFVVSDPSEVIKGTLKLNIVNTTSNKLVYSNTEMFEEMTEDGIVEINLNTLAPDANYLVSIEEVKEDGTVSQYFQKLFRTDDSKVSLEKSYITDNSLSYNIVFEDESQVKGVTVTLYDEEGNEVGTKVINKTAGVNTYEVAFKELNNNSTYKMVVNSFILGSGNYGDQYTITKSNITLKSRPIISNLQAVLSDDSKSFKLSIGNVVDNDKSITKYIYNVYNANDLNSRNMNYILNSTPIATFEKKDTSSVDLEVDNENIKEGSIYIFEVIAEYYDNEKIGEVSAQSDKFAIAKLPSVTFELDTVNTSFNSIYGTITLVDENCTVPIEGRECTMDIANTNTFVIEYYAVNDQLHKSYVDGVTFDAETLTYDLSLLELNSSTEYVINVYGNADLRDGAGLREDYYIGKIETSTTAIDRLKVDNWQQGETDRNNIINETGRLATYGENISLINKLSTITFNIYKGDISEELSASNGDFDAPLASFSVTENIKENYYDQDFNLTLSSFGIDINTLRELGKDENQEVGKLARYYTIELTDAYDENQINNIKIDNNIVVIEIPAIVLLEEELEYPTLIVSEITNNELVLPKVELNGDTVVGYNVQVNFDISQLYTDNVYFKEEQIVSINYYAYDLNGNLIQKNSMPLSECNANCETKFYLENGTVFNSIDYDASTTNTLKRGNNYIFKFDIDIDTNDDLEADESYPYNKASSTAYTSSKQDPKFTMYIDSSTTNTITYKYTVSDIDNALSIDDTGINYFYYNIDDEEQVALEMNESKTFTLSNLNNKSVYEIFYKRLLRKGTEPEKTSINAYTFDGYYEYNADILKYKLVYSNNDNILEIALLDNEDSLSFVNRISLYELSIIANSDTTLKYENKYTTLSTCTSGEESYKCIKVDYANIEKLLGKDTTVSLKIYYDNGYIGYNSIASTYSLLQTNIDRSGNSRYLNIESSGSSTTTIVPRHYYTYALEGTNKIKVYNANINGKYDSYILSDTQNGKLYTNSTATFSEILNRKGVSIDTLVTDDNQFRFDSITPKISINSNPTINGSNMSVVITGLTETKKTNEFIKDNDGKYYLYLDFYKTNECDTLYRQIKIDFDNLSNFNLNLFMPDTTYYFKVNAYMKKNGVSVYTELFDAKNASNYVTSVYSLTTLNKTDIYRDIDTIFNSETVLNDGIVTTYAKRTLITNMMLNNGKFSNMGLKYEIWKDDTHIERYDSIISSSNTALNNSIRTDITGNDFVFGNYYNLKVYATTRVLNDSNIEEEYRLELYNGIIQTFISGIGKVDLRELVDPTYNIKKSSSTSSLTFRTTITDNDKVIKNNGVYTAKLCNSQMENCITQNHNAVTLNNNITFTGLTSNTEYIFVISSNIFKNNASLLNQEILENKVVGTYTNSTVEKIYKAYTAGVTGVSIGNVVPTGTLNGVILTFEGGTNITNITDVIYTIREKGNVLAGGSYKMGIDKNFDYIESEDNHKLNIGPLDITFSKGVVYDIELQFYVNDALVTDSAVSYSFTYEE